MIINKPNISIDWGDGPQDLSSHVIAAAIDAPTSVNDARTFAAPHASNASAGAQSITLTCNWNGAMMAVLEGMEGVSGNLVLEPTNGAGPNITATVRFAVLPMPTFAIGEKAEMDLVLAVRNKIVYSAT